MGAKCGPSFLQPNSPGNAVFLDRENPPGPPGDNARAAREFFFPPSPGLLFFARIPRSPGFLNETHYVKRGWMSHLGG